MLLFKLIDYWEFYNIIYGLACQVSLRYNFDSLLVFKFVSPSSERYIIYHTIMLKAITLIRYNHPFSAIYVNYVVVYQLCLGMYMIF